LLAGPIPWTHARRPRSGLRPRRTSGPNVALTKAVLTASGGKFLIVATASDDGGRRAKRVDPLRLAIRLRLSRYAQTQLLEKRWVVQLIGMLAGLAIEELRILAD